MFDWTECAATPQQQARLIPFARHDADGAGATPNGICAVTYGSSPRACDDDTSSIYGTAPGSPTAVWCGDYMVMKKNTSDFIGTYSSLVSTCDVRPS